MKCNQCGMENESGALKCVNCGASLHASCPVCGAKLIEGRKYCMHCGSEVFLCINCGAPLGRDNAVCVNCGADGSRAKKKTRAKAVGADSHEQYQNIKPPVPDMADSYDTYQNIKPPEPGEADVIDSYDTYQYMKPPAPGEADAIDFYDTYQNMKPPVPGKAEAGKINSNIADKKSSTRKVLAGVSAWKILAGASAVVIVIIVILVSIGGGKDASTPTGMPPYLESAASQTYALENPATPDSIDNIAENSEADINSNNIDVYPSYYFDETLYASVVANSAGTIRSAPKTGKSLDSLSTGETVKVLGTENEWYFIEYDGDAKGWMSGYVLFAKWMWDKGTSANTLNGIYYCGNVFSTPLLVSVSGKVSLSKGPGTDYEVIRKIKKGEIVTVIGEEGEWYFINDNLKYGWIPKEYVPL